MTTIFDNFQTSEISETLDQFPPYSMQNNLDIKHCMHVPLGKWKSCIHNECSVVSFHFSKQKAGRIIAMHKVVYGAYCFMKKMLLELTMWPISLLIYLYFLIEISGDIFILISFISFLYICYFFVVCELYR